MCTQWTMQRLAEIRHHFFSLWPFFISVPLEKHSDSFRISLPSFFLLKIKKTSSAFRWLLCDRKSGHLFIVFNILWESWQASETLNFRTQRSNSTLCSHAMRECTFPGEMFKSDTWTSSNLFTFSHQHQLEVTAAIDTFTGLKPVKGLKHLQVRLKRNYVAWTWDSDPKATCLSAA